MKAITLHEPWATLLALGAKVYETRSWSPDDFRGPIAIHAGKNKDNLYLVHEEPFKSVLNAAGFFDETDFVLGAVIGIAHLTEVLDTNLDATILSVVKIPNEREFGDFGPDRFAWKMAFPARFVRPIMERGYQKLWDWDAPAEVMASLR